jgi:hypothetical protein
MTTLTEHNVCVTPAGGGGNITGTGAAPTSLAACITAAGAGVSEPPTADDSPPEVRSDEIGLDEIFDIGLGNDDDSDERAYPRSRRLICSASSETPPVPSTNTLSPAPTGWGPSISAFHAVTPAHGRQAASSNDRLCASGQCILP